MSAFSCVVVTGMRNVVFCCLLLLFFSFIPCKYKFKKEKYSLMHGFHIFLVKCYRTFFLAITTNMALLFYKTKKSLRRTIMELGIFNTCQYQVFLIQWPLKCTYFIQHSFSHNNLIDSIWTKKMISSFLSINGDNTIFCILMIF